MKSKRNLFIFLFIFIIFLVILITNRLSSNERQTYTIRAGEKLQAYGLEAVPVGDLSQVRQKLDVNLVVVEVNPEDDEISWQKVLTEVEDKDLKVIIRLVPQPWKWTGQPKNELSGEWDITKAESFLTFLDGYLDRGGESLFALYLLRDPFWRGNFVLGYSSAVQKKLYQKVKQKAPSVNLLSDIGSLTFWDDYSEQTRIEAGMFDYGGVWFYPFSETSTISAAIAFLEQEAALLEEKEIPIGLVFRLQAFSQTAIGAYNPPHQPGNNFYLPQPGALKSLACQVLQSGKAEVVLYQSWREPLYGDYLADHPELWEEVNWAIENCQP